MDKNFLQNIFSLRIFWIFTQTSQQCKAIGSRCLSEKDKSGNSNTFWLWCLLSHRINVYSGEVYLSVATAGVHVILS